MSANIQGGSLNNSNKGQPFQLTPFLGTIKQSTPYKGYLFSKNGLKILDETPVYKSKTYKISSLEFNHGFNSILLQLQLLNHLHLSKRLIQSDLKGIIITYTSKLQKYVLSTLSNTGMQ